jgi:hypothetical protein
MLYVTKYENGKSSFGGMVRVKDIERLTQWSEFLTINLMKPFHYSSSINENGNKVFNIGVLRFKKIISVLNNHSGIYFHTVGNFIKLSPYLPLLRSKKKIIDLHGSQPEEFSYSNKVLHSFIFGYFEKLAFSKCDVFIHVSKKMITHFCSKYPGRSYENLYVPIFSSIIDETHGIQLRYQVENARIKLKIFDDKPIYLYSGGVQAWQKSELVIHFLTKVLKAGGRVIILSMQSKVFESAFSEYKGNPYLTITSASPNELSTYYIAANYGIMFRDEHTLNVVASPTKLSEYLYYGMIPILTSTHVGDFVSLGIDYLNVDKFPCTSIYPQKSYKNQRIVLQAMKNSEKSKLKALLNAK